MNILRQRAEKHYKYAPSPSAILRARGTIVENSYYFAHNGELVLKDGSTVACDFEVGYMQDASAWAVVYITFPQDMSLRERNRLEKRISACGESLTGTEDVWGRTVKSTLLQRVNLTSSVANNGTRVVFLVENYEISFEEQPESGNRLFDLVNLSVHFSYSPSFSTQYDRADAAEQGFLAGVDAAVKKAREVSPEKSLEEVHALALRAAENARKASTGDGFLKWWFIPIKIGKDDFARLYWRKNPKELTFSMEPISRLWLNTDRIPLGWEPEAVAEWLCALFSMALGRDIQWTHWIKPSEDTELPPSYETWQVRNIQQSRFVAFAEEPHDAQLATEAGLYERNKGTLDFIEVVLGKLMQRDMVQIEPYLNALRYYIGYAAVQSLSYEFECTLLSVLGEYIYKVWTGVEGINYKLPPDQKKARKSIIEKAKAAFFDLSSPEIDPFVPAKPGEPASEHATRRNKFIEATLSRFSKSVGYSQTDQLAWFFESHGYQADRYPLAGRIVAFVESRNALVHEHCFHNEREGKPQEIDKEIANIRMMIPLMFAAILGYQGRYWDSCCDTWATTPSQP